MKRRSGGEVDQTKKGSEHIFANINFIFHVKWVNFIKDNETQSSNKGKHATSG